MRKTVDWGGYLMMLAFVACGAVVGGFLFNRALRLFCQVAVTLYERGM